LSTHPYNGGKSTGLDGLVITKHLVEHDVLVKAVENEILEADIWMWHK
jgi:hypothetical protein